MIQPPDLTTRRTASALLDRRGPVTCAACGCRLDANPHTGLWYHFHPMAGRDARGCLVPCADAPHDAQGLALA